MNIKKKLAAGVSGAATAVMSAVPAFAAEASSSGGSNLGGYLIKGGIVLAVGAGLYVLLNIKSKKPPKSDKK